MALKAALWLPGKPVMQAEMVPRRDVWGGKKILLSRTLELGKGSLGAVIAGMERAGGIALVCSVDRKGKNWKRREREKEVEMVEDCDVFVTRWRGGAAYVTVRVYSSSFFDEI
jgi:hypothetical protein